MAAVWVSVTSVKTEGGASRLDDSKQRRRRGLQRPGRGSGAESSDGGHLRWRTAGVLSGTPPERHLRALRGASAPANCRTYSEDNFKNEFCTQAFLHSYAVCTCHTYLMLCIRGSCMMLLGVRPKE